MSIGARAKKSQPISLYLQLPMPPPRWIHGYFFDLPWQLVITSPATEPKITAVLLLSPWFKLSAYSYNVFSLRHLWGVNSCPLHFIVSNVVVSSIPWASMYIPITIMFEALSAAHAAFVAIIIVIISLVRALSWNFDELVGTCCNSFLVINGLAVAPHHYNLLWLCVVRTDEPSCYILWGAMDLLLR